MTSGATSVVTVTPFKKPPDPTLEKLTRSPFTALPLTNGVEKPKPTGPVAALPPTMAAGASTEMPAENAGQGERQRRRPGTAVTVRRHALALERLREPFALLAGRVDERADGGIAMVGGDDQPPALCQLADEGPESIRRELFRGAAGQCGVARAGLAQLMDQVVRPGMPEAPAWLRPHQARNVRPGCSTAFSARTGQTVAAARTIVLQRRALREAKRLGEFSGCGRQLRAGCRDFMYVEAAFGCTIAKPWQFAE